MKLVDTHCHIQMKGFQLDLDDTIQQSLRNGVDKVILAGTDIEDSQRAIEYARNNENLFATAGLHPHDAKLGRNQFEMLEDLIGDDVVAIGECGLDYHYQNSSKKDQLDAFEFQLGLASKSGLPLTMHVRDAFEDFWTIIDRHPKVRGVIHSFTSNRDDLEKALARKLLVGLNGIVTFTKDQQQLETIKRIPLEAMLLETDAPFLTPTPFRGKINQPKYLRQIVGFLSSLRDEPAEEIAAATTKNAEKLFKI